MIKSKVKQLALAATKYGGLFRAGAFYYRSRLLVLCYHSVISDASPDHSRTRIAVTVSQFEKQLQLIRRYCRPISLAEIDERFQNGKTLPQYSICITFDDGFRNNLIHAAPLLKKYEIPAIVFVTTGCIDNNQILWPQEVRERVIDGSDETVCVPKLMAVENQNVSSDVAYDDVAILTPVPKHKHEREILANKIVNTCKAMSHQKRCDYLSKLRHCTQMNIDADWKRELYDFMSWDEVREIRKFGIEIGAHTVSHPILSSLDDDDLHRELHLCKTAIETKLGKPCFSIAYPNGGAADFTPHVVQVAKEFGFRVGFNLYERRNALPLDAMSIDRRCITRDVNILEFERTLVF